MRRLYIALSIILCYIPALFLPILVSWRNPLLITIYMLIWVIYIPILLAIIYYFEKVTARKTRGGRGG